MHTISKKSGKRKTRVLKKEKVPDSTMEARYAEYQKKLRNDVLTGKIVVKGYSETHEIIRSKKKKR